MEGSGVVDFVELARVWKQRDRLRAQLARLVDCIPTPAAPSYVGKVKITAQALLDEVGP